MRAKLVVAGVVVLCGMTVGALAIEPQPDTSEAKQQAEQLNRLPPAPPQPAGHIDDSGRTEKGRGSFYANSFAHRKMADGRPMNPNSNVAASKVLPLGSVAKVTNLNNGKSETVKIEDRGPYVDGRIVDLSPKVAGQLDLKHKGVVPVEVKPITLPQPDGEVKLGSGAAEASPQDVKNAIALTRQLTKTTATETADK